MSLSPMPHPPEPEEPFRAQRPSWLVCVVVTVVCLAVVASGWGVARFAVGGPPNPLQAPRPPVTQPSATVAASTVVEPTQARAYVAGAAERVEGSSAFHITFTAHDGREAETGRGHVTHDSGAAPEFDHVFTTADEHRVYRYDPGEGPLMMSTEHGLELLDPPSEADQYLCSREYGSAKLREVLDTSTDLRLEGREEVRLEAPGLGGTHSTHHYTGTFTTRMGGYDPEHGRNTLTDLEGVGFDLWIDERGYPRRFDYRTADGVGESYEYHSFN